MATQEPSAFEQFFPSRELFRGKGLVGLLWSGLASVLVCVTLLILALFVDLLTTRGELIIDLSDSSQMEQWQGLTQDFEVQGPDKVEEAANRASGFFLERTPFGSQVVDPAAAKKTNAIHFVDAGLLPTVWRVRERIWQRPVTWLYGTIPLLRTNTGAILCLVGAGAFVAWLRSMASSRARACWNSAAVAGSTRMRRLIYRQAMRLGPADLDGGASQQCIELFTKDVDAIEEGISYWLGIYGRDVIRLACVGTLLIVVEPTFCAVAIVPLLLCWYLTELAEQRASDESKLTLARSDRDLRILAEGLAKTRLVRGYQMENYEQLQFEKSLERLQDSHSNSLGQRAWSRRLTRTFIIIAVGFVALFLAGRVLLPPFGTPLAGGVSILAGFVIAWQPLRNLAARNRMMQPANQASDYVQKYLAQTPEVGQAVGAKFLQPLTRLLTFEGITYAQPGKKPLLNGLDMKIPAGRQVAIVSTDPLEALSVACLIPRFIEPQSGRILIDNADIGWVTLDSLRAEAVFVGGKDPCISGSIRDNIACGNANVPLNDVTEAAKATHAHNFIQTLPQGYETIVGEQGEQLDIGQSFRLGLARALLRNPALLIIEEPAGNLDEDTKSLLDDAFKRLSHRRTVLIVPRRLSTLRRCDEIVFIHQGKLVAIGPRDRLVQSSPLYRHWEYLNFNEFRHEFETGAE